MTITLKVPWSLVSPCSFCSVLVQSPLHFSLFQSDLGKNVSEQRLFSILISFTQDVAFKELIKLLFTTLLLAAILRIKAKRLKVCVYENSHHVKSSCSKQRVWRKDKEMTSKETEHVTLFHRALAFRFRLANGSVLRKQKWPSVLCYGIIQPKEKHFIPKNSTAFKAQRVMLLTRSDS